MQLFLWRSAAKCLHFSLPYTMAARTAGIDRNEEITSLSTYVYGPTCYLWLWLGPPLTAEQYVVYFRFFWMT